MSEVQPPKITKNTQVPTECPVTKMGKGSIGTIFLGETQSERMYFIEKPEKNTLPVGSRCRLSLLKRAAEAGIQADLTSSCSWCGAKITEEKFSEE